MSVFLIANVLHSKDLLVFLQDVSLRFQSLFFFPFCLGFSYYLLCKLNHLYWFHVLIISLILFNSYVASAAKNLFGNKSLISSLSVFWIFFSNIQSFLFVFLAASLIVSFVLCFRSFS